MYDKKCRVYLPSPMYKLTSAKYMGHNKSELHYIKKKKVGCDYITWQSSYKCYTYFYSVDLFSCKSNKWIQQQLFKSHTKNKRHQKNIKRINKSIKWFYVSLRQQVWGKNVEVYMNSVDIKIPLSAYLSIFKCFCYLFAFRISQNLSY